MTTLYMTTFLSVILVVTTRLGFPYSGQLGYEVYNFRVPVRNHVKLRGFSKDTLLFGGYWLWAWRISWGLQTCIAERSKVPNG